MQAGEAVFQSDIVDIPMDKITLGNSQARQRDTKVSKDDDLVTSIKKFGLLSPILVRDIGDGGYELVAGQRRYYAHQELAQPTIKARILAAGTSEAGAKKISFIENLVRKDMKHADYVDTVEWLMDHYGKASTVAEELGISVRKVNAYMAKSRLPKEIKDDVNLKEYEWRHAEKALDVLGGDVSMVNVANLRETAKRLNQLTPQVQNKVVKIKKSRPEIPIAEAVKKAKETTELHIVKVEFSVDQDERIEDFMSRANIAKKTDAVSELIDRGLGVSKE